MKYLLPFCCLRHLSQLATWMDQTWLLGSEQWHLWTTVSFKQDLQFRKLRGIRTSQEIHFVFDYVDWNHGQGSRSGAVSTFEKKYIVEEPTEQNIQCRSPASANECLGDLLCFTKYTSEYICIQLQILITEAKGILGKTQSCSALLKTH